MRSLFLIFVCTTASLALAAEANLIASPGFEQVVGDQQPAGWRVSSEYPFAQVAALTGGALEVHSGQRALRLVQTGKRADETPLTGAIYTEEAIPVQAGVVYQLRVWARGEGLVSPNVYCYAGQGATSHFVNPPAGAITFTADDETATKPLTPADPWRELRYSFSVQDAQAGVAEVRVVLNARGSLFVDDVSFMTKQAAAAAPAQERRVRPNLLGVGLSATAPAADGQMRPGEYALATRGLVDCDTQEVYSYDSAFGLSWDGQKLYLAATVQLPPDQQLQVLTQRRDDPALIATRDVFYLMLRPDRDPQAQTYQGAYLAVTPEGTLYDAWEEISWAQGYCRRDSAWNGNWQVRSQVRDHVWTIELSVPLADLRLKPEGPVTESLISFGFNVPPRRLAWQAHPNWFDHFRAFGELRLLRVPVGLQVAQVGSLQQGRLAPQVVIANGGPQALPYELTALTSTPTMVGGEVAGWAFETALGVQPREVVGDQEVHRWRAAATVAPSAQARATDEATLPKLGHYVLELVASAAGAPLLYQKLPFQYLPPITGTLTPIPSKELIRAELSFQGARPEQKGSYRIVFRDAAGKTALQQDGKVTAERVTAPVSMATLAPGDYAVSFVLLDPGGKETAREETRFRKWATPIWQAKPVGIEALAPGWCPAPWTPLQRKGNEVTLWGRTMRFGPEGLLTGVTTQGRALLDGPMAVKFVAGGREQTFKLGPPRFTSQAAGRVEVIQEGTAPGFRLQARQRLEFDGMDLLQLTITPQAPVPVEKLWVEVPLREVQYGYLSWLESLQQYAWQAGLISDEDFKAPRRYVNFWLGNDRTGCGFFAESCKGWLIDARQPRISLQTRAGQSRAVRFLIVNAPAAVKSPLQATFGLQPTPVKPLFAGWRNLRPQGLAIVPPPANLVMPSPDYWNSGYSKPSPRSWPVLTDMMKLVHGRGQKAYPYIGLYYVSPYDYLHRDFPFDTYEDGHGVPLESQYQTAEQATRLEEWFYYQEDWNLSPPSVSRPTQETRAEARVSAGSRSYADFFVHGVAEMLQRTDLDGLYLDIDNPVMNLDESRGLLYQTADGTREGTVELLAARDMYKRLYCVFDQLRGPQRKPYLLGHGAPHAFPYMSFWDVCFHGEEIKPADHFEATKMFLQQRLVGKPCGIADDAQGRNWDAAYYRAASNGIPYGLPLMYLPQYGYDPKFMTTAHSREHIAWTFMHNNLLWPAYIPADPVYAFWSKVEVPFGLGDATFHPYWENGVRTQPECVKVSTWTKPGGKTLIAVANWSGEAVAAQVQLPAETRGPARDMESGEQVTIGETWTVTVPSRDLRVFLRE